jgi:uroporphyrinogen-III decarboxylase
MLTIRQNLLETIHGGKPDRFVNQYEYMSLLWGADPITSAFPRCPPGTEMKDGWGVTIRFKVGQPGPFPVHDDEYKVVKDITHWKDAVKPQNLKFPESAWEDGIKMSEAVDRNETYATVFYTCGVFERLHYLQGIDTCLMNFYEEPEATKELLKVITDWELAYAELVTRYIKPNAIFHHDDWGTQNSSFIAPDMFEEFIEPCYKQIYSFYKNHGVELIVHHSDSYAANLVPHMIRVGIDVWQGCITTNNVPDLVKKYGGKISFMGDINNGVLDKANWTKEEVRREVERACKNNGKHYFIPGLTMGDPGSIFPGVYEAVTEEINRVSKELF